MTKIKLTDEQLSLFKNGNITYINNPQEEEEVYYYYPYYLKKDSEDLYEIISPEKLPEHVRKFFSDIRESQEAITISKKEYIKLQNDSNFLRALQSAGVDNWDGYDIACDNYEEIDE